MKKIVYLLYMAALAVAACNNNQDDKSGNAGTEVDTLSMEEHNNDLTDENLAIINETGFSKYARTSLPQLKWDQFTLTKFWQEDSTGKTSFAPSENYFDYYGQFLKYSPDSSKFIDLDSYNISLKKNTKGQLIGGSQEPDTEVSLIDRNQKEKTRLLFLGPGNSVEDAAWIDNNKLVLIGYIENDSASGTNAAIWQFNLPSKRVNLYELSDSAVVNKLKNYSERERLKKVIIR